MAHLGSSGSSGLPGLLRLLRFLQGSSGSSGVPQGSSGSSGLLKFLRLLGFLRFLVPEPCLCSPSFCISCEVPRSCSVGGCFVSILKSFNLVSLALSVCFSSKLFLVRLGLFLGLIKTLGTSAFRLFDC